MKKPKLHSYFGSWAISIGETLYPVMFTDKKKALSTLKELNKRYEVQSL